MRMKELPNMERPYEKLETYGAQALSMAELLAIIIKTGTKRRTSMEIAQELLTYQTEENGVGFLHHLSMQELMKIEGIGRVKAIELKAVAEIAKRNWIPQKTIGRKINTPEEVYRLMSPEYKHQEVEALKTIILDSRNKLIRVVDIAVGTANSMMVPVKDIFKEPIKAGAVSIILVHNHPSGDVSPSTHDLSLTKKVRDAAALFGMNLMDHVIIGNGNYYSMKKGKKF